MANALLNFAFSITGITLQIESQCFPSGLDLQYDPSAASKILCYKNLNCDHTQYAIFQLKIRIPVTHYSTFSLYLVLPTMHSGAIQYGEPTIANGFSDLRTFTIKGIH